MASTANRSAWPAVSATTDSLAIKPTYSPALDFVAAVATADTKRYGLDQIGMLDSSDLRSIDDRLIGRGGLATVEFGKTVENGIVAIKRMRVSAKDAQADFANHLRHLCVELRILCHEALKSHANIIDVLGYCLSEVGGLEVPFMALVLEYSSLGSLKTFLCNNVSGQSIATLKDLATQVAAGLEALHLCKICHGDVKIQNTLVFGNEDKWIVKLSDFGGSIIGQSEDLSLPVKPSFGTRLMNAPEIRNDTFGVNTIFTIDDAIRTDVFSFGLMTWEVLKHGSSYYDESWFVETDGIDGVEEYLEKLPCNGLLSKARDYVKSNLYGDETSTTFLWTFQNSLQDDPIKRCSMMKIRERLEPPKHLTPEHNACQRHSIEYEPLCTWSTRDTLSQLRNYTLAQGRDLKDLPFELLKSVALDLKYMANSEAFIMPSRSHAAMCVAECYSLGLGLAHDTAQVVHWIYRASELGSLKAVAWYPRMCSAFNPSVIESPHLRSSFDFEANLAHLTSDMYLSNRISLQIRFAVEHIDKTILVQHQLLWFDQLTYITKFGLFSEWELDDLLPMHLAALLGDDASVSTLLCRQQGEKVSSQGFTAVHYACIGGNLSTLKLLLSKNLNPNAVDVRGITPLHLCIFFDGNDASKAAALLLTSGGNPDLRILKSVDWEYHDIVLYGTPLDWAASSRHKSLVRSLLRVSQSDECLVIATQNFFWDIAEIILQYSHNADNIPIKYAQELSELTRYSAPYLINGQRPFAHWIAHGPDHVVAMERTVQTCLDNDIVAIGKGQRVALLDLVQTAEHEDGMALIAICAAKFPPEDVKRTNEQGETALLVALMYSANFHVWRKPLEAILSIYTVDELEQGSEMSRSFYQSYLHFAIDNGSVIGTRLLLEKGMDPNQGPLYPIDGGTCLALARSSRFPNELYSLLVEHGARDDATHEWTGTNMLASSLLDSKPNGELLRNFFRSEGLSSAHVIGAALHETLRCITSNDSMPDNSLELDAQANNVFNPRRSLVLKIDKADELTYLWNQLEDMTGDKEPRLELLLGEEQLASLLSYLSLDPKQRPSSLELTLDLRQAEAIYGVDGMENMLRNTDGPTWSTGKLMLVGNSQDLEDCRDSYWLEVFELQLGLDNWAKYINDTDESGMTLIQRAAVYSSLRCVTLLLEAGANASISSVMVEGVARLLPLELVCYAERARRIKKYRGEDSAYKSRRGKYSMEVALELLDWHHGRSDGLFEGITKHHLAYRMLMKEKFAEDRVAHGFYKTVKGHWPGFQDPVSCEDLLSQDAADEVFSSII